MAAILMIGAAGQGKTQAAIQHIRALRRRRLFGNVWVLLPSDLQIQAFRARLLEGIGEPAYFGVEFFEFYALYARLLEIAGTPQRHVQDAARFRILRHVLTEALEATRLQHFSAIAETPGFVRLVADLIQELKQARVGPEQFTALAHTPKDHDLALIYTEYQNFLRERGLVDRDGEGWLALALLEQRPDLKLGADLLIVDGYDQFNIVQAQLLGLLAARLPETLLTLTYQPDRAETAHRRYAQTRTRLLEQSPSGVWTEKSAIQPPAAGSQPSATLAALSQNLFEAQQASPRIENDGSLRLVEAPDRRREVQTVLRQVKRLLLAGVAPEQIAVLMRNLEPYSPYFLENAPAYGIPITTRQGSPLKENAAIATLLALIDLAEEGFRRQAVIDLLNSAYLTCPDLTPEQVDALDRLSREQAVVRGRAAWLEAIDAAGKRRPDEDEDALSLEEQAAPGANLAALRAGLESFFQRVTPPPKGTARDYVRWLESIIGPDPKRRYEPADLEELITPTEKHFRMIPRIRAEGDLSADPAIIGRDLTAMLCLKRVFRDLLAAYELVDAWTQVSWEDFRRDLLIAIENTSITLSRTPGRLGRVLVASVYEARGLHHDHMFVLGLSEGEFPARTPEDALYLDSERAAMQRAGLPLLTRQQQADEGSLFYEITGSARRTLMLTRPYIDERSNPWSVSPYWRAVCEVVGVTPERLPIAEAVDLADAARPAEAVLALAWSLNSAANGTTMATALGAHNWLLGQPALAPGWLNALAGRRIELRRESPADDYDAHTGRLADAALIELVAEALGPERMWSASQFNDYGTCPYRFFARRLLKLEALVEPKEGMDRLQHGSVLHELLEHTYRRIGADGLTISAENRERALQILAEESRRLLADAPWRHGFRTGPLWEAEKANLRQQLDALITLDFSVDSPVSKRLPGQRRAFYQEIQFGVGEGRETPLVIDGAAGPLLVTGKIDRLDDIDGHAVVIDYKSGATPIKVEEMIEGRNVQMLLYLLAARQILTDKTIVGGAFWHIRNLKLEAMVLADAPELELARASLHQRILDGRQGIFVSTPSKQNDQNGPRCARYCEFSQLCRLRQGTVRKGSL